MPGGTVLWKGDWILAAGAIGLVNIYWSPIFANIYNTRPTFDAIGWFNF